jgi:hypothetical protein
MARTTMSRSVMTPRTARPSTTGNMPTLACSIARAASTRLADGAIVTTSGTMTSSTLLVADRPPAVASDPFRVVGGCARFAPLSIARVDRDAFLPWLLMFVLLGPRLFGLMT